MKDAAITRAMAEAAIKLMYPKRAKKAKRVWHASYYVLVLLICVDVACARYVLRSFA